MHKSYNIPQWSIQWIKLYRASQHAWNHVFCNAGYILHNIFVHNCIFKHEIYCVMFWIYSQRCKIHDFMHADWHDINNFIHCIDHCRVLYDLCTKLLVNIYNNSWNHALCDAYSLKFPHRVHVARNVLNEMRLRSKQIIKANF